MERKEYKESELWIESFPGECTCCGWTTYRVMGKNYESGPYMSREEAVEKLIEMGGYDD